MIDIVIPVHKDCAQLDTTLKLLEQYKNKAETRLTLIREGTNVSEARQIAMNDKSLSDMICFLDYDSEMCMDGWLDEMIATMSEHDDAGAVFSGEWWGREAPPEMVPVDGDRVVQPGNGTPAACMLIDRSKLDPEYHIWDQNIGLRNGWLGGDFEEVDFCYRLEHKGLELYTSTRSLFHHTGGKGTYADFSNTDRRISTTVMRVLLRYKHDLAPDDEDYFKDMKYVKADANDDDKLAVGSSFRDAYRDVFVSAGLAGHPMAARLGLT